MTDALGWRAKFGVLAPSTNTIVEPDFYSMHVPGVTAHFSRIHIRSPRIGKDQEMIGLLDQIRAEMSSTIERVLTAEVDYMVMGMSAETFWGGADGNAQFTQHIADLSGLRVATGAEACVRGLRLFEASRIGVITPYQPVGDKNVKLFFTESGFDVVDIVGLRCPTAVSIAHVPESQLRDAIVSLTEKGVDAIVQCGTNLSMVALAASAENMLGIPVIAINAATWWMALRENGIMDKVYGRGRLLCEH